MDLGRTRLSIRSGLYKKTKEKGWGYGVVGGVNITYLKSLAPFQKFYLKTKLAGHHDGWFFIEQRFESKNKLVAAALVKVTFLKKGKRIPAEEIIKEMGVSDIGENKEYLAHLFKSEKEFLEYVKKDYS
jgi:acyl-CoA thioesterase FadM